MAFSRVTRDHSEIRRWAKANGAEPAQLECAANRRGAGILRFFFPKAPQHNEDNLKRISWEEFFEKFDKNRLEMVYDENTIADEMDRFEKLVHSRKESTKKRRQKAS
jgi:hypothetical protein